MRFAPSTEQQEFRDLVREFLSDRAPEDGLLARIEQPSRFDRALWREMTGELELLGLAVPEQAGGLGYGLVEHGLIAGEFGRALTPVPYFATTALTLPLLLRAEDTVVAAADIGAVLSGERIIAAALAEPGLAIDGALSMPQARYADGRLTGESTTVIDGDLADAFLVPATSTDGVVVCLVEATDPDVSVTTQRMLDPTRGSAAVHVDGAPARVVIGPDRAGAALAEVLTEARIALAFEQLGGAERCLEIAVDHAKTREQFGRPIGSFQAVKHQCSQVLCDIDAARCAVWYAAWAADQSASNRALPAGDNPAELAITAKYLASEAFLAAARMCVHTLGGIGFTWEHVAQLFFKRATSSAQWCGSPADELARLADLVLPNSAPDTARDTDHAHPEPAAAGR